MDDKIYRQKQISYTIGFVLSIALTVVVYFVAKSSGWSTQTITITALAAAALQVVVQSRFFLHVKRGKIGDDNDWQLGTYLVAWAMLSIIVFGSLWVIHNLNYNMGMTPDQMLDKIKIENTKGF